MPLFPTTHRETETDWCSASGHGESLKMCANLRVKQTKRIYAETILVCPWEGVRLLPTFWNILDFAEILGTCQKFPGALSGTSLTVDCKINPEVSQKFPRLPKKGLHEAL